MFWIISGLLCGSVVLLIALRSKADTLKPREIPSRYYYVTLCTLILSFAFLLFYKAGEIPMPFHVDEAGMAYDALSIANHHIDRYGYKFPVYFINFGGGQNALYTYLAAVSIRLFGFSAVSVRLPALVLSLISALVFALVIRKEEGNNASLIAGAVFCILPFSIMHSRWGLESYLLFPMLVLSCGCLCMSVRTGRILWFVFSGILFGLTLYSYAVSYMILPLFLGVILIWLLVRGLINWKQLAALMVPLVLLAVPLMLLLAVNSGMIGEIRGPYFSVPKLITYRGSEVNIKNIPGNLGLGENNYFYRVFVWDKLIYNVIPKFGTVFYFNIPLILYGLYLCLKDSLNAVRAGKFSLRLMLTVLFLIILPVSLLLPYTNVNRSCALFLPLIFFLFSGLYGIFRRNRLYALVSGGINFLLFLAFLCCYFTEFPKDLAHELSFTSVTDIEEALTFAENLNQEGEPLTIYGLSQPYIYTLLVKHIDPYAFSEMKQTDQAGVEAVGNYRFQIKDVSPERIFLLRTHGWVPEELRQYDFRTAEFGTVTVYYP